MWLQENTLESLFGHLLRHLAPDFDVEYTVALAWSSPSTMAGVGLISSPKPLSYLQQQSNQSYNPYQVQRGLSAAGYSDTPPLSLAQPIPHQPTQFMGGNMGVGNGPASGNGDTGDEDGKIYSLVIDLMEPGSREGALLELSKKREQYDDLALVLWHSFGGFFVLSRWCGDWTGLVRAGIMPALLQEIVSVYPLLSPPNLTAHVSNRVCNALALLQCVASHSETRQLFLNGALNSQSVHASAN
jgi:CCR4-NOT transcription complex subunit 9